MRKLTILAIAFLFLAGLFTFMAPSEAGGFGIPHAKTILAFRTMYGVDGPFVKKENTIRNVPSDELPWVIRKAVGKLNTNGRLKIVVRGLVFKDDPSVPPELRGINDEEQFRGLVSCLTEIKDPNTGEEVVETRNVTTEGFPATESGDSFIKAKIELPNPCVAPIIMVLNSPDSEEGDKWFAVTGFEAEED
jgi:hypothetical protein